MLWTTRIMKKVPVDHLHLDWTLTLRHYVNISKKSWDFLKLENANIESIVKYINSGQCKKIITMAGAGISTSAGIPDFRSPGSGLYHNLEKYKLPNPMAIFELDYFRHRPEAFFTLAKELYPGSFKPTPCHYFLKLLHEKGLLLRHFTQNIDNLERIAGLPDDVLVEAHGSFHTSHCLTCKQEYALHWMKERIFSDVIPTCDKCNGLVKPDIVFFGENLPYRYFHRSETDFPDADLLIIMGTSLVVQPFCSLVDNAPPDCPRLLLNKEKVGVGTTDRMLASLGLSTEGLGFDNKNNVRDVFLQRDCDSGCHQLADMLGWGEELKQLISSEHARLDQELKKEKEEQEALTASLKKTSLGEKEKPHHATGADTEEKEKPHHDTGADTEEKEKRLSEKHENVSEKHEKVSDTRDEKVGGIKDNKEIIEGGKKHMSEAQEDSKDIKEEKRQSK
uniref:NAD-dependent protein deacetylase sirtuin-2 n=1 Tax=Cacopsylla melanoneura TaxID=428564 RepID=A0A8D8Y247_9HEMI